jgi:hypothetical protein
VIEEIYQNYEIGEMLSFKKAQKIRIRGTETIFSFILGLLKLRNTRAGGKLNDQEQLTFAKFFNQGFQLCQDNQWVLRKICAEKLEELGLEFNN